MIRSAASVPPPWRASAGASSPSPYTEGRQAIAPALAIAWRFAALTGLTTGLAGAPFAGAGGPPGAMAATSLAALCLLAVAVPRLRRRDDPGRCLGPAAVIWLACIVAATAALGLAIGSARIGAIDAGAIDLEPGREISAGGFVSAVPRRSQGQVSVTIQTPDGRLLARAPEPVSDLSIGAAVRARGTVADPGEWERSRLERLGIRDLLTTTAIEPRAGGRGGLWGALDAIRSRAEAALGRGTPRASASLLRGFVLGQDDRIEAATVDDFKRSGLAHLLAVSGQNVVLLAVLAGVILAALDVRRRTRLILILALIVVYVPVAGAGASIQRAGVMGAAGIVAALAERPRSRAYAVLLATAATLALDPRASADVGWQLSFAAVVGIMAASAPISAAIGGSRGWHRGLADAVGLTLAATLATAPLLAHHFGTVSIVSLPANLVALPAVAPVMWLGMLAGVLGQLEWLPVEPLTWLAGVFAGYIAQVAEWFAKPGWAQIEVELGGGLALLLAFLVLALATLLTVRWAGRSRGLRPGQRLSRGRRRLAAVALLAAAIAAACLGLRGITDAGAEPKLRVSVLDVGQGDAILLEPRGAAPVLVDAGPPDGEVAGLLESRGVESLAALAVTHPDLDHDGGAAAVLERLEVGHLVGSRLSRTSLGVARANAVEVKRIVAGDRLRSGALRIEVLWPPPGLPAPEPGETNLQSLVLLARVPGFEILLTGDAEAEAAAVEPGVVDVLKVAHHGSEDAGLPGLLEATDPRLALISVGDENAYGHPHPGTLAELAEAEVPVMRTDESGELSLAITDDGWTVR